MSIVSKTSFQSLVVLGGKWGGRLTSALLLVFWGSLFVEHTAEWFLRPDGQYPPLLVWFQQTAHFAMLVGLSLMLKWERLGGLILVIATVTFFGSIGMHHFPFLALINLVPIALFCASWLAAKRAAA